MSIAESHNKTAGAYAAIAPEYYDGVRHPTCANFREASLRGLRPWLDRYCNSETTLVEVGAGRSVVLEFLHDRQLAPKQLLITDVSSTMLDYSKDVLREPARLAVAPATDLPLGNSECALLVASLGDPYNRRDFWQEAFRVLQPSGKVLFTTPSHEWAGAFRKDAHNDLAEFELASGQKVCAPSMILEVDEQLDLMQSAGFRTLAVHEVLRNDLRHTPISPKLMLPELDLAPIVRAYLARKV